MTLEFIEEGHIYTFDGQEVPSVSEIIRFISKEVYGDIDEETLQYAAERGTAIHKACEVLDEYGIVECTNDILPYLMAYKAFLEEHTVEWELIEQSLYSPDYGYAGTIDRYGMLDGNKVVLDIKSCSKIQKVLVKAQLNGYFYLATDNDYEVDSLYCLQLKPSGKYTLYEVSKREGEFENCLMLHEALLRKQPRGGIK